MEWKNKISAERLKVWKERILLIVLAGVLLLVIMLPTSGSGTGLFGSEPETVGGGGMEDGAESGGVDGLTGDLYPQGGETEGANAGSSYAGSAHADSVYAQQLEMRLAETLSYMDGVGEVKVMITLRDEGTQVVEKDIPSSRSATTEVDSEGGSRSINEYESAESTIYATDRSGTQTPYVVSRIKPEIEGVVVVAQGGGDARIAANITEAIQALFGLEAHKIKVVKMTTLENKERSK